MAAMRARRARSTGGWVNTMDGIEEVVPGTGRWLLYTPFGEERGWLHGAVRSLALVWLAREFVRRDWLRWSETFSIGIRKAIVPANADDEAKDIFHRQVASLGSETTVLLQKPDSGVGFDIDVLFPSAGDASGGFNALMDKLESRMAIRILGQNLSTEVSGGSLAAASSASSGRHPRPRRHETPAPPPGARAPRPGRRAH